MPLWRKQIDRRCLQTEGLLTIYRMLLRYLQNCRPVIPNYVKEIDGTLLLQGLALREVRNLFLKNKFSSPELQCTGLHKIYCLIAGAFLAVIFLCSCWIFVGKCTNLKKELAAARKDIQDQPRLQECKGYAEGIYRSRRVYRNTQR